MKEKSILEKYAKDRNCPYCDSSDVDEWLITNYEPDALSSSEWKDPSNPGYRRKMICESCGSKWMEYYSLTSIKRLKY